MYFFLSQNRELFLCKSHWDMCVLWINVTLNWFTSFILTLAKSEFSLLNRCIWGAHSHNWALLCELEHFLHQTNTYRSLGQVHVIKIDSVVFSDNAQLRERLYSSYCFSCRCNRQANCTIAPTDAMFNFSKCSDYQNYTSQLVFKYTCKEGRFACTWLVIWCCQGRQLCFVIISVIISRKLCCELLPRPPSNIQGCI